MGSIAPEMVPTSTYKKAAAEFRQHLPDLKSPRFTTAAQQSCYEYVDTFRKEQNPPWLYRLTEAWAKLYSEPYTGVTTDGNVILDLFPVQDEGVPVQEIAAAVENALSKLTPEEKEKVSYPITAKEWRGWSNPEFLLRPFGVRLEETSQEAVTAILAVLKASFSPEGYKKAIDAMEVNHFLGEICHLPRIMNRHSYNFLVFGTPSATESWGWSIYGHHLCLNVFLKGPQIIISPWFTGAEPNVIDDGPHMGTAILHTEGELGLKLMQSLTLEQQQKAQIYKLLHDPAMLQTGDLTVDRWNKDDQRHVCGAFRDNRIVPYEGVAVRDMTDSQKSLILSIAEQYLLYLPHKSRAMKLKSVEEHFDNTHFCWIGGYGNDDAFYYRIQSPVLILEFDHHSGVFLNNEEPGKFHTHTILRTPNAGDYGNALRKEEERL